MVLLDLTFVKTTEKYKPFEIIKLKDRFKSDIILMDQT